MQRLSHFKDELNSCLFFHCTFPPGVGEEFSTFDEVIGAIFVECTLADCARDSICRMDNIHDLYLEACDMSFESPIPFAACKQLREVHVCGMPVGDRWANEIGAIPRLEVLSLAGTRIQGLEGISMDARRNIRRLDMRNSMLNDEGAAVIQEFIALRHLDLRATEISDATLARLPQTLTYLDITDADISLDGLRSLSKLRFLRELLVSGNAEDVAFLWQLPALETLVVSGTTYRRPVAAGLMWGEKGLSETNEDDSPPAPSP